MSNFQDIITKSRGYDAFKQKEQEVEERQKNWTHRFWLKPETEAKIIFLDDDPIIIEEHNLKLNGRWTNWFTCRRIIGEPCILCDEVKDTPYTVGFYTILDLTEYTTKKGDKIKNTIKLFAPKFKALQLIKRQSQKRGGLELCVFDVFRSSSDAFNVGDSFEFEEKTDWETIKKLNPDAAVLNYAEILAPKSNAELKKILNHNTESNLDTGLSAHEEDEEEVEF
jgi:hypothetical protein